MGDGVNIAARLEGICEPGAICISEDAYRQVKGRLDLAVRDLGPTQLKNIVEPIRIYSLEVGKPTQAKSTPTVVIEKLPPRLSIVVLPFANIGGDAQHDELHIGKLDGHERNPSCRHSEPGKFRRLTDTSPGSSGDWIDLVQIPLVSICLARLATSRLANSFRGEFVHLSHLSCVVRLIA
jgi:hypothetical protein